MPFLSRSCTSVSSEGVRSAGHPSAASFKAPKTATNSSDGGRNLTTDASGGGFLQTPSFPPPLLRLPGLTLSSQLSGVKARNGAPLPFSSDRANARLIHGNAQNNVSSFERISISGMEHSIIPRACPAPTRIFRPPSSTIPIQEGEESGEKEESSQILSANTSTPTTLLSHGGVVREVQYPECRGATVDDLLQRRLEKRLHIDYHQPESVKLSTTGAKGKCLDGEDGASGVFGTVGGGNENEDDGNDSLTLAGGKQGVQRDDDHSGPTTSQKANEGNEGEGEKEEDAVPPTSIVSRYPVSLHGKLYFQVETNDESRHDAVGIILIDVEQQAVMMFDRVGRQYGNRPEPGYPLKEEDVARAKAGEVLKVGSRHVLLITALCEEVFRSGSFFLRSEHSLRIKEERLKAKEEAAKEKERRACKMTFGKSIGGANFSPPPLLRKRPRDGETGFIVPLAGRPKRVGDGRGGFLMEELRPLHDPDAEKAVVLFRADYKRDITGRRQVSVVVDPIIGDKLRPHQITGVQFLYQCIIGSKIEGYHGAILADEMGLGKTIQTVAIIYTCLKQGRYGASTARKCIVITPSSLVRNWCNEFDKWLGEGAIKHFSIAESTPKSDRIISRFDSEGEVLVISYDQLRKHIVRLSGMSSVELVVCDEGHRLKNAEVKTTKAVDLLPTKNRIILSGTPIQNDLKEFHAMVNFVNPLILGHQELFGRVFEEPILAGRDPEADPYTRSLGRDRANYLSTLTQKFILRRTQSINESYLPPKVDMTVFVRLGGEQEAAYRRLSSLVFGDKKRNGKTKKEKYSDEEDNFGDHHSNELPCRPLVLISALRKLCNHLDLFYDAIELSNTPSDGPSPRGGKEDRAGKTSDNGSIKKQRGRGQKGEGEGIPRSLLPPQFKKGNLSQAHGSKIHFVSLLLDQIREGKERDKLVIVSNFTQTLDIIAALCKKKNIAYFQLDGSTPIKKRQELVDDFNVPMSQEIVFLLSSKAGGVGLNLIGANRLILFDPDWNPANDAQAMGRVWRDGQKKRVFIYRLLCTGTIEEKVYQRQVSKQGLSANVVDMQEDSKQHFTLEELKSLFSFKSDTSCETHDLLRCDEECEVEALKRKRYLEHKNGEKNAPSRGFMKVAGEGSRQAAKQSGPRMDELKAWKHVECISNFQLDTAIRSISQKAPTLLSFLFADERDNEKKKRLEGILQIERPFAGDEEPIRCSSQAAIQEKEEQETEIEIISDCSSSSSDDDYEISD